MAEGWGIKIPKMGLYILGTANDLHIRYNQKYRRYKVTCIEDLRAPDNCSELGGAMYSTICIERMDRLNSILRFIV